MTPRPAPDPRDARTPRALAPRAATDIRLLDATDLTWIAIVVDVVMSCVGLPWRTLRERLEHAPVRPARAAAIITAMRRIIGGRAARATIARKIRAAVLGPPALDDMARIARLAAAEEAIGLPAPELESLLWVDLADERPVTLPDGRPDERRLAELANADRIAHTLRRARHVRIHATGDPQPLIRTAQRYGLLVTSQTNATHPDSDDTTIDIDGPLSLFHHTTVYGRALGAIVPMLSLLDAFIVEIDADFGHGPASLRVTSPALLPPAPPARGRPSIAARIAMALDKACALGEITSVEREPAPLGTSRRLYPDLAFTIDARRSSVPSVEAAARSSASPSVDAGSRSSSVPSVDAPPPCGSSPSAAPAAGSRSSPSANAGSRWYVEVVGFATAEFLAQKLARYRDAGVERVVLVVDGTHAPELPADDAISYVETGAVSVGAVSVGAVSVGAVSVGAVSVGAVSVGAVSVGAVSVGAVSAVSVGARRVVRYAARTIVDDILAVANAESVSRRSSRSRGASGPSASRAP